MGSRLTGGSGGDAVGGGLQPSGDRQTDLGPLEHQVGVGLVAEADAAMDLDIGRGVVEGRLCAPQPLVPTCLRRASAELCVFRLCGRSHLNRDYAALRRANLVLEQQAAEYRSQLPSATPSSVQQRAASYVPSSNGMLWGTLDPRCVEFESVREQLAGPLGRGLASDSC